MSTWFYDVPRPIYLVRHALARFELRNNTYKYYTEKLVGPLDEEVSSDDQEEKSKESTCPTSEEQCEELFSQVRSGNDEAATQLLETMRLIEKEKMFGPEGDELVHDLARRRSSNEMTKSSSSDNEPTSVKDKPKSKVNDKAGLLKTLFDSDNENVAEKSQQAPKYVTEAVKKVLEMDSEPDVKAGCCNNIPKLSSSALESTSKEKDPKSNSKKMKDSGKSQKGHENAYERERVDKEGELDSKTSSCNDIPKSASSESKATLEQGRLKLKAKRNIKGQKVKQSTADPKGGECISEADRGKGGKEGPQSAKEAIQQMKEQFMEQEEVRCTATTCKSPIVVQLPLPAPRTSESTEEILRR